MAAAAAASSSSVLFLLLTAMAASGANATLFTITNKCNFCNTPDLFYLCYSFPVWPAAIPVGGGRQLNRGETWNLDVPAGTSSARIWPCTGCSFNGGGRGSCATGDCAGALSCSLSGRPPATLAEFTLGGAQDCYDISVIDGFNVPMDFSCSTGAALRCRDAGCPDAYHNPPDVKTHACSGGNRSFRIVFCP